MKLRGGILYYTLFLMLISVTLISLILLRHLIFQHSFIRSTKEEELRLNIKSAFLLYRHYPHILPEQDSIILDLYTDSTALITLRKEKWGIFDLVTATAGWKDISLTRMALCGEVIDINNPALYVPDHGMKLSLSGDAFISGTVYAPDGLLKTASIEGQPFIYDKVSEGKILPSQPGLPALDTLIDKAVYRLFSEISPEINLLAINRKADNMLENAFTEPAVTYYAEKNALLSGLSFKGHIIICAPGTIIVDNTTSLDDVILVARRIVVKEGFRGSMQAFAIDEITIGDYVKLIYPSVLCINGNDDNGASSDPKISFGRHSTVTGCIILKSLSGKGTLTIPETSLLTGQAYCNCNVRLTGDVHGSFFCNGFTFVSGRSTYSNHLLNSDINITLLPEGFAGYFVCGSHSEKGIIRWVN